MGKEAAARSVLCSHLNDAIRFENLSSKITSSNESLQCDDCRKLVLNTRGDHKLKLGKRKKSIWVCLACGQCTCSGTRFPTTPHSHAPRHARHNRHPLAVQLANPTLCWCFTCNTLIPVNALEQQKDILLNVIKLFKPQKSYMVKGLINLGNTCFFNSILQNLLAMDTLRDHYNYMTLDEPIQPLSASLKQLFLETSSQSATNVVNPRELFNSVCAVAPRFKGFQQQDSHELLRFLLDGLCNESCGVIDTMFGGQTSSSVCCLECGHSSVVYEPYLDLSLPLPTKKTLSKLRHPFKRHMDFGFKNYKRNDKLSEFKLKESHENSFDFSSFLDCVKPSTVSSSDYDTCVWDDSDNDNDVVADDAKLADDLWMYRLEPVSSSSDHNATSQNEKPSVVQNLGIDNDVCWDDEPRIVKESEVLLLPDEKISSTNNGFDWFRGVLDEPDVVYGPALDPISTRFIGNEYDFFNSDSEEVDNSDSPVSVDKCLADFTSSEILARAEHAWHCEQCSVEQKMKPKEIEILQESDTTEPKNDAESGSDKVTRDASKRILINSVPPILTIHLKRLSQDARGRLRKLNGHVDFKEIIDLEAYMDPRCKDKGRYKYRLIGVVEHTGTMRGGHYVAYVRGGEGGKLWYNASDAYVREVSLEEVLRCEAYILFYQQM